jgi:stage V sporulation protein SpoVS
MPSVDITLNEEYSFLVDGTSKTATLTPRKGKRTITNIGNATVMINLKAETITGTLSAPYGANMIMLPKYSTWELKKRQVTFTFRCLDVAETSQLSYGVGE